MGTDTQKNNVLQIPPAASKLVQNLKEVVNKNCTDTEIYAVLTECNMDPNDAVQRLLSQDAFREVKSKREKRKEIKVTHGSKSRGSSKRGVKYGVEPPAARIMSTENDYSGLDKAYKRENVSSTSSMSSSSFIYRPTGKIINEQPLPNSDSSHGNNRRQPVLAGDTLPSSWQPSPGADPVWQGVNKGNVSMADIVRGGRTQNNDYQALRETSSMSGDAVPPNTSGYNANYTTAVSGMIHTGQRDFGCECPAGERLTAVDSSLVIDSSAASEAEVRPNQSFLYCDRTNLIRISQSDLVQVSEKAADIQQLNSGFKGSASGSSGQVFVNAAGGVSNKELLKETSFYSSHELMSKHHEDMPFASRSGALNDDVIEAISSAAENLEQLNIGTKRPLSQSEKNCSVVLPDYLQALAADCSHLSFGTYRSKVGSASNPSEGDLEVSEAEPSDVPLNIRNSERSEIEQFGSEFNAQRAANDARNHGLSMFSQSVLSKQAIPEARQEHQYISSSVGQDSRPKSNLSYVINPNARNLPLQDEFSHSQSIPSDLLASAVQALRARDQSAYTTRQSVPSVYGNAVSSVNMPLLMPEVLDSGCLSLPQPSSHIPSVSNLDREAAQSQHLSFNSYSASRPSLGGLDNMSGYPSMARNQTYVSSANLHHNAFNNSVEDVMYNVPEYRDGATMGNLPFSKNNAYNNGLPGNFLHNLSTSVTGNAVGYGLSHSQYKDGNDFTTFQQNNYLPWGSGIGSRAAPELQDDAYYSLLGQNPSIQSRYRQSQQSSYDSLEYPNMHPSQGGIMQEHQWQRFGDFHLTDTQRNPASKQLHQIWPNKY